MKNITFSFAIGKPKKNGLVSVYLRILKERKKKDINIGIQIEEKHWKKDQQKVIYDPLKLEYNAALQSILKRASAIIIQANQDERDLSLDEFADIFLRNSKPNCFFAYAEKEIERMKPTVAPATHKNYLAAVRKLKAYKEEIALSAICNDFLRSYASYLKGERGNSNNTINKNIKYIRTLLKTAVENGEAKQVSFNVKTTKTDKDYLTLLELEKLESLSGKLNDKLQNTLDSFLFSCYTGLRYSDLKKLRRVDVRENSINIKQEKTDTRVFIPLCKKALSIIENQPKERIFLFKVYSNQKMNDYLTALATRAGIYKNITCHVARHTFATISLNLGIPIEALSDVLGHSDLKTTKIYARMLEETKRREFSKWDEIE